MYVRGGLSDHKWSVTFCQVLITGWSETSPLYCFKSQWLDESWWPWISIWATFQQHLLFVNIYSPLFLLINAEGLQYRGLVQVKRSIKWTGRLMPCSNSKVLLDYCVEGGRLVRQTEGRACDLSVNLHSTPHQSWALCVHWKKRQQLQEATGFFCRAAEPEEVVQKSDKAASWTPPFTSEVFYGSSNWEEPGTKVDVMEGKGFSSKTEARYGSSGWR